MDATAIDFTIPYSVYRLLSGGDEENVIYGEEGHSSFGVHVTYEDLYNAVLFLFAIYVAGQLASRILRMPDLVGQIVAGILLGPELLPDFVPYPEAFVLFGEIG